jgi:hypothetical protein
MLAQIDGAPGITLEGRAEGGMTPKKLREFIVDPARFGKCLQEPARPTTEPPQSIGRNLWLYTRLQYSKPSVAFVVDTYHTKAFPATENLPNPCI